MKKILLFFALLLNFSTSVHAVLNEQDLAKSLSVLKEELEHDNDEQQQMLARFDSIFRKQHRQIMEVMQRSNQVGLMLYSQQADYTFDLAYACHEATALYKNYSKNRQPYNKIVDQLETEIDRYARLIKALEKIPPMPQYVRDSMFAHISADSMKAIQASFSKMKKDTASMNAMKATMLDAKGQIDRDSCLVLAKVLLAKNKELLATVQGDNEHYDFVNARLKEANDYAETRYQQLQRDIFVNGGPSYFKILADYDFYQDKMARAVHDKYVQPDLAHEKSDWRGSVVFGLLGFVLFYMLISGILGFGIVKGLTAMFRKRGDKLKSAQAKAFVEMSRDKHICTALTLAVILFAIALMFAISFMKQNFLVMACKLLIEFAWLLGVILLSLLVRLPSDYIKGGFRLYVPMVLMGFFIIGLRVVFVPNALLNVFFPVVLMAFMWFQWHSNRQFKKKMDILIQKNAKIDAQAYIAEKNAENVNAGGRPKYIFSADDPALANMDEKQKAVIIAGSEEALGLKELEFARKEEKYTHSDVIYAWISFFIMLVATFVAFKGYTFLSLQIFIWWLFQLTCIHTITSLFDLLGKGEERYLKDKMYKAAYELECKLKGVKAAKKAKIVVDHTDMKERSKFISQTWFYDLCRICVVPVLATFSIFFSILWAADVFNLREFCKTIFFANFIDVEGVIQLSVAKITVAVALFFVFKFFKYLVNAIYLRLSQNRNLKNGEASASMFSNLSALLIWGIYFIVLLNLLQVPKSGISLVTAGLATGVGFAMKDLLENLFYGISLMSGRVRVGEWIECDGVRGKVENISYQSTSISTLDGYIISFLNASLFTKNFKNLTRNHEYEFLPLTVGVAYGTNIEKARKVIEEAVTGCREKLDNGRDSIDVKKGVKVIVSSLSDSSIDLYVSLWTDVAKKYWVKGRCLEAIYNALNENNISIPFPQRDVHIIKETPNQ